MENPAAWRHKGGMKSRIARLILLPLAGFLLGWWTRGTTASTVEPGPAREVHADPPRAGEDGEVTLLPGKRTIRVEEEFTAADRRREAEDQRRMRATCQRKLELKVEEWARQLDLSDAEVRSLLAAIGPAMEGLDPPIAESAIPGMEALLNSMLQGDRWIAFHQLRGRQREALASAKVEARLAEMNAVLLLDPAQQVALRESLAGKVEQLPDPSRRVTPGLSPEVLAEVSRRLAAANDDGSGFMEAAGAVVRESIDADLDGLAGILSADQLETYRRHLEESHAQWLPPSP